MPSPSLANFSDANNPLRSPCHGSLSHQELNVPHGAYHYEKLDCLCSYLDVD